MDNKKLLQFLDHLSISYEFHEHKAVYTSEQARQLIPKLPGVPAKNLFLRDKKGNQHFLLTLEDTKAVDLKSLAAKLGISKLSLASPERLMEILGIEPGAVSLLALVNDVANKVRLLADREVWQADQLQCHPLVNTATLVISHQDIIKFLELTGHTGNWVEIDSPPLQ